MKRCDEESKEKCNQLLYNVEQERLANLGILTPVIDKDIYDKILTS